MFYVYEGLDFYSYEWIARVIVALFKIRKLLIFRSFFFRDVEIKVLGILFVCMFSVAGF